MTVRKMIGLLLGTFLAVSLLSALPAPASAVKPRNDFPRLPRVCATPKEQIPQKFIFCKINTFKSDRPTVFVWGDSHAFMMVPAVKQAVAGQDVNLVAFVLGSCPPVLSGAKTVRQKRARSGCEEAGDLVFRQVKKLQRTEHKPKVVIGLNWDIYMTALERARQGKPAFNGYVATTAASFRKGTPRLFDALGARGIDVDVLAPVGQVPTVTKKCRRGDLPFRCSLPRARVLNKEQSRVKYATQLKRKLGRGARLINVNREFCNDRLCKGTVRGTLTWYDDLHISATMARERMARYFQASVADVAPATVDDRDSDPTADCGLPVLCRTVPAV